MHLKSASNFPIQTFAPKDQGWGPSLYYVSKVTGWVGSEKWQFLLTLSTIYADVESMGESEEAQKCADVV